MIREARVSGMSKLAAQAWAYSELDRLYPPPPEPETKPEPEQPPAVAIEPAEPQPPEDHQEAPEVEADDGEGQPGNGRTAPKSTGVPSPQPPASESRAPARNDRLQGLDEIPPAWPALPASAALGVEVGWVQANRLAIVAEGPTLTRVDLSRAAEPAPSRSALAWLETSIRSYAKFTDVLAKVAAAGTDEGEDVRRERSSLAEIERLLGSMGGTV